MQLGTNSSPVVQSLPQTDVPEPRTPPEAEYLRQAREVIESIRIDCLRAPEEYLDEVRVPGGGE